MALLGALLLVPTQAAGIFSTVRGEDFYDERHAAIFNAIKRAYTAAPDADLVLISNALRDRGSLEMVGGNEYLVKLANETPSAVGAPHYARLVRDKARLRRVVDTAQGIQEQALKAGAVDTEEVEDVCREALAALAEVCRPEERVAAVRLAEAERGVIESLQSQQSDNLPTGVGAWDRVGGGMPRSGLCVLAGYPGGCKTTLAMTVSVNMALAGSRVRVFSYEQNAKRIAATVLSGATGYPVHDWLNTGRDPTGPELDVLEKVARRHDPLDFKITERGMDAPAIFNTCVAANADGGAPGVAVVDYVQDLPPFGPYQEITPKITESMRWLARIARDLGWLVIAVSQLDKQAGREHRRPQLSDGLGSSAIEQRADLFMSVWRPYQREAPPRGAERWSGPDGDTWRQRQTCVEVASLKNKYGALATCHMAFDGRSLQFRDPTEEETSAWMT